VSPEARSREDLHADPTASVVLKRAPALGVGDWWLTAPRQVRPRLTARLRVKAARWTSIWSDLTVLPWHEGALR
jgi:hypothetical protein